MFDTALLAIMNTVSDKLRYNTPMLPSSDTVRSDFDRIAAFENTGDFAWNHNSHFHPMLLVNMPKPCHHALEIGCGAGALSRKLARVAQHVTAFDLSPEMLRLARERSAGMNNLKFIEADVMTHPLPAANAIVSVATLHHLPLETALQRFHDALLPGGVLLVVDLYQESSWLDALSNLASIPFSRALAWWHQRNQPRVRNQAARDAWNLHGEHDVYPSMAEVGNVVARVLPGARVSRHLLWRYSITWRRPG